MKKYLMVAFIGLFFATCLHAQTVESQNVVGFFRVNITGGGAYSLISAPMQKMTVTSGDIESTGVGTIIDDDVAWTAGEFNEGVNSSTAGGIYTETGLSTYYVEISGPTGNAFYGRHYKILSNTSNILTVDGADFSGSDLVGALYKIVPFSRVRDVFGESGSTPLQSGTTANDADSILFWNGSGWDTVINSVIFGGWAIGSTRVDNRPIDRDEGFFLKRLGTATNLTVTGEVSANDRRLVLSGSGGYDLMRVESVKDIAIGDSELDKVFQSGTTANDADSLLVWNGSGWDTVINSVIFGGWSIGSTRVDSTLILEAGKSYFVKRIGAADTIESVSPLK